MSTREVMEEARDAGRTIEAGHVWVAAPKLGGTLCRHGPSGFRDSAMAMRMRDTSTQGLPPEPGLAGIGQRCAALIGACGPELVLPGQVVLQPFCRADAARVPANRMSSTGGLGRSGSEHLPCRARSLRSCGAPGNHPGTAIDAIGAEKRSFAVPAPLSASGRRALSELQHRP
jgi:hypothetical protein